MSGKQNYSESFVRLEQRFENMEEQVKQMRQDVKELIQTVNNHYHEKEMVKKDMNGLGERITHVENDLKELSDRQKIIDKRTSMMWKFFSVLFAILLACIPVLVKLF